MTPQARPEPRDTVRAVMATTWSHWWPTARPRPLHRTPAVRPAPVAPGWSFAL